MRQAKIISYRWVWWVDKNFGAYGRTGVRAQETNGARLWLSHNGLNSVAVLLAWPNRWSPLPRSGCSVLARPRILSLVANFCSNRGKFPIAILKHHQLESPDEWEHDVEQSLSRKLCKWVILNLLDDNFWTWPAGVIPVEFFLSILNLLSKLRLN